MAKSVGLSIVAVILVGAALVSAPDTSGTPATPFWQLQGAAPAATDTLAIAELRQAARIDGGAVVVALNDQ